MYKVLTVEDEDIIRKGLIFIVNWQQADCVVAGEAADGLEGLERIREARPDIVIVDINMPVMDGLEMLEKSIRGYGFDAIIVPGYNEFEYTGKAVTLEVAEYLLKPANFNELYNTFGKVIQKQMAAARLRDEIKQINMEKKKLGILDSLSPEELAEGNPHVEFMVGYIGEHYYSRISLTDVSEQCGMSCTYLNTKFKSGTGYTFSGFLDRYRMQKTVELLKGNKCKVYEIADLVGSSDYKYFIKILRRYIGCSPVCFIEGGGNPPE